MSDEKISYADFAKLDIRVGKITGAEKVEKTDKLVKLDVDIGDEKRTLVAGIAENYEIGDLVGKNIIDKVTSNESGTACN